MLNITLDDITYNSRYVIQIKAFGKWSKSIYLLTPKCNMPRRNMTTCPRINHIQHHTSKNIKGKHIPTFHLPLRRSVGLSL